MRIGDAALTPDALASQYTATAPSDTCLAADSRGPEATLAARRTQVLEGHVRHLAEALRTCRSAHRPARGSYRRRPEQLPVPSASASTQ